MPTCRRSRRQGRRVWLIAGCGLVAVLLIGIAGTIVGLVKVIRAEGQEAAQRETAEAQRDRAVAARDRTREVLDAMTSEVTGDSLEKQAALSEEQKKFLTGVLAYYREFAGETADDEPTRARTAGAAF